ncbi:GntR family transcriptional regulator [Leptothoe sp. PORK10 BA2]|uniref:GntR family transcriptional regulator n=1 Tax=Leptothoe sp. PORK10 BA2 TaxID=3110254 RepID=UPI002B2188E6|nr:GntR family transcriptional regulator [Leptothoe sp. PORK10 BA2]MEA5463499.1 GntR family transcriptional regulator [Leptothoe sp. PORK10 BA2]
MTSSTLPSRSPIQRREFLSEQVYTALRNGILKGKFLPGSRLIETQLTDWFKVSRTPLREALRQLQREGLVTANTKGLQVATLSATDAIELYDCRLALEKLAVAGACKHASPQDIQAMEECVIQSEAKDLQTNERQAQLQLLNLDYQFHHLIAESSGNQRLVLLLGQLFDSMALLRIQTLQQNPSVLDIKLEHRQVYEAIAQKDADLAIASIQLHLLASKTRVVREIQNLSPDIDD